MAVSQNGYSTGRARCGTYTVPGTRVRVVLRKGAVATVLLELARRFDNEVEDIDTARTYSEDPRPDIPGGGPSYIDDEWGYAGRPVRGGVTISNHASGTAVDLDATQHPLGKRGTFTAEQVRRIRVILSDLVDPVTRKRVIRWGGDYIKRADEMHFEINASEDAVARVSAKIKEEQMPLTNDDIRRNWTAVKVIENDNETGGPDKAPDWTPAQAMGKADRKLDDLRVQARIDLDAVLDRLAAQDKALAALAASVNTLEARIGTTTPGAR